MKLRAPPLCAASWIACCVASAAGAQCNPTAQIAHLFADDYDNFNYFGSALVWNDDGIFVGASGADDSIGAVYAFEGEPSAMSQTKIRPLNLVDTWFFGVSVAVDAPWMAVSASDFMAPPGPLGMVLLFKQHGVEWIEVGTLYSPSGVPDGFGAVALGGTTLFVGASLDDDAGPSAGAVYVFELQGSQWVQTDKLVASDVTKSFGARLSLLGDRLLVGATGSSLVPGAVFVFERTGNAWIETAKLEPAVPILDDRFGDALAQEGDTVVVGARADSANGVSAGAAYVFSLQNGIWVEDAKLLSPEAAAFDQFGSAVALSGDVLLVGSPYADVDGEDEGAVWMFLDTGESSWLYAEPIHHPGWDDVEDDLFGKTIAMKGHAALIGLPNSNQSPPLLAAGSAILFDVPIVGPSEVVRLGVPPNPNALLPGVTGPPVIGGNWRPHIDHTAFFPEATADLLGITAAPANVPTPFGTLLCDLAGPPPLVATASAGQAFALPVPFSCPLVGLTLCAQGASTDGAALLLTNALDLRVGQL